LGLFLLTFAQNLLQLCTINQAKQVVMNKYKHQKYLLALSLAYAPAYWAQEAQQILGRWQDAEDQSKKIEIYLAKDGLYYGKIEAPQSKDHGKIVFGQFRFDAQKHYFMGKVFPPEKDISLSAEAFFETDTRLKIVAKKLFLSKTIYFIKQK
jgi:hypothetical protein